MHRSDTFVSFKEIFTTNVFGIYVNPHWSVRKFMDYITPILSREFSMDCFEIVETGQETLPAELAAKLEISDVTLETKWGSNLNVSFYIRKV